MDDHRHLFFARSEGLEMLGRVQHLFVDGTFKLVRKPWRQLWTVHTFVRSGECVKMVPLLFVLMSSMRAVDYNEVR